MLRDILPAGFVPVVIGIAVLVVIAGMLDWLLKNPAILLLIIAVISGSVYLYVKRKRARDRV